MAKKSRAKRKRVYCVDGPAMSVLFDDEEKLGAFVAQLMRKAKKANTLTVSVDYVTPSYFHALSDDGDCGW